MTYLNDDDEPMSTLGFVRNALLVLCGAAAVALYFTQCGCGPAFEEGTARPAADAGHEDAAIVVAASEAGATEELSLFEDAGPLPDVNQPEAAPVQEDAMPVCSSQCPACVLGSPCRADEDRGCAVALRLADETAHPVPVFGGTLARGRALCDVSIEQPKVALVGGLAMQLYGSTRLTADIDVVVHDAYEVPPKAELLNIGCFSTKHAKSTWTSSSVTMTGRVSTKKPASEQRPCPRRIPHVLGRDFRTPPRHEDGGRSKDELDARYLALMPGLNHAKAKAIIREHLGRYAVDDLKRLIEEAKWRRGRGEDQ